MTANSSPNLFRLSLPEWLREQVESGKHKGVYWIEKQDRIFHVPWKHASRNGWEDEDVSLFKAWAIYTNRYREGVDKARPALWKTNFRCAINSHNSIAFLKNQGQRKGDKAHRIMQLVDPPKRVRRSVTNSSECSMVAGDNESGETPRKLVRLTYPNFGPPPPDGVPVERGRYKKAADKVAKAKEEQNNVCKACTFIQIQMQDSLKIYEELHNEEDGGNIDFQALKIVFTDLSESREHLCQNVELMELMEKNLIATKDPNSSEELAKPNLQDLYFIGKALQSAEGNETLKVAIKVESGSEQMEIVDSSYGPVDNDNDNENENEGEPSDEKEEKQTTEYEQESKAVESENDDSFFENKEQTVVEEDIEIQEAGAVEVICQDGEEEEDLITPR